MVESVIMGLLSKLKGLWLSEKKSVIEGHVLSKDSKNNQSLLLIKEGEKLWKSKWFNDEEYTYRMPKEPLATIFN
jgi:hypothetical protein